MTTFAPPRNRSGRPARHAAHGLALAAAPTFALMAGIAAHATPAPPLCASGSSLAPVEGMTAMYLLMSLVHLGPWLTLVSGRTGTRTALPLEGD